ncbi:MAG TPA: hypothetical protein VIV57_02605, partial [Anaeromyxobacter sp.]
ALLAAAAPSGAAEPSPKVPPKILPRSSVAAVLAHRGELGLDDDQIRRLERIDDDLQRRNAEVPAAAPGERGGRRAAGSPAGRGEPKRPPPDPERVRNDNDTAAYLQAEEILRPEQRDRAREIAERYREELYDQRAAARKASGR